MPRTKRQTSKHGIYHVMIRGVNKQRIFEDDEDRFFMARCIKDYKAECDFLILAWCFMKNHVHLVLKFDPTPDDYSGTKRMADAMKKIEVAYAKFFNEKYERCGHLFQDRYKSETVDDERYLYTVVRYVHKNPVKAGISRRPEDYIWSSYEQYLYDAVEAMDTHFDFADTSFLLNMHGIHEFIRFNNEAADDQCLDEPKSPINDKRAKAILLETSHCMSVKEFLDLPAEVRVSYIKDLYSRGLNVAQMSRITGINKRMIFRIVR